MKTLVQLILICSFIVSCSKSKVEILADLPTSLKEISAIEKLKDSDVLWVIQDAGNSNHLFGLNLKGQIIKDITIKNADNIDWEDLASDSNGNIYIGDFGNNNKNRTNFTIYKILNVEKSNSNAYASLINFTLPEGKNSIDFESFFLYEGNFYMFSKDSKKCELFKVPNLAGNYVATFISKVKLKGKHTKVTSADISDDGNTVVLLNHNRLWTLTEFTNDDFFSGQQNAIKFKHDSQKEGVKFVNDYEVLITDEKTKQEGGNLYRFNLKSH